MYLTLSLHLEQGGPLSSYHKGVVLNSPSVLVTKLTQKLSAHRFPALINVDGICIMLCDCQVVTRNESSVSCVKLFSVSKYFPIYHLV